MGIMKILVCVIAIPFVIMLLIMSRALSRDIYDPVAKEYIPDHEGKLIAIMGFVGAVITTWALYEYIFG